MIKYKSAFSLVELTVVVGLVAILSVAISSIVLTSIVQSSRIRNQIRTRQSGDYAIGQIQTMVRNARDVISCDSSGNSIDIINPDGFSTSFFEEDNNGSTGVASNSGQYLTAADVTTGNSFDLECLPSDTSPRLIKVSFDLTSSTTSERATENPPIHYATSIELRNN